MILNDTDTGMAQQLREFGVSWGKLQADVPESDQWANFFRQYERLDKEAEPAAEKPAMGLDAERLKQFLEVFEPALSRYERSGALFNVWKVAQLGHDERRNCKVLANLLDHREAHGHGSSILCRILQFADLPELAKSAEDERYITRTENWPLENDESRIDIEIEGTDFLVFIEAKINAPEGDRQIARYLELARNKADARGLSWAVLYLTRDRRKPVRIPDDLQCNLKPVSWRDIARAVRQHLEEVADHPVNHFLNHYADFLGAFR